MRILKAIWVWFRSLFRRSPVSAKISRENWRAYVKGFAFDQQPSSVKPTLFANLMSQRDF